MGEQTCAVLEEGEDGRPMSAEGAQHSQKRMEEACKVSPGSKVSKHPGIDVSSVGGFHDVGRLLVLT